MEGSSSDSGLLGHRLAEFKDATFHLVAIYLHFWVSLFALFLHKLLSLHLHALVFLYFAVFVDFYIHASGGKAQLFCCESI